MEEDLVENIVSMLITKGNYAKTLIIVLILSPIHSLSNYQWGAMSKDEIAYIPNERLVVELS
jgi:hypothetical protein